MLAFSRLLTALTGTLIALLLLPGIYFGATLLMIRAEIGQSLDKPMLAMVGALFMLAVFFGLPNFREKLISASFFVSIRIFLFIFSGFALVLAWRWTQLAGERAYIDFPELPQEYLTLATILGLALLFLTFFIPGYAYTALRMERRAAQGEALAQKPQSTKPKAAITPPPNRLASLLGQLFLLLLCGLGGYGWAFAQFIASPEHGEWVERHQFALVGISAVLLYLGLLASSGRKGADGKFTRYQYVVFLIFAVAFSPMSLLTARIGVPAVLSLQNEGPYEQLDVIVVERGDKRNRRTCDYVVDVTWDGVERHLCNVPSEVWELVRNGDTLTLTGYRTPYGFRFEDVDLGPGR